MCAHLFRLIPHFQISQVLFRPRRQDQIKGETEDLVDVLQKLQGTQNFVLDLFGSAEYVGVVLLEPPHSGQTGQGSGQFVTM